MNDEEMKAKVAAQEAADLAVRKVFAILGVDIDVPKEVEDFRRNLDFAASMRRHADKGLLVVTAGIFTALLAALWSGVVHSLWKGH